MGNKLAMTKRFHVEISSKLCEHGQSDCLCGNRNIARWNLPRVTRPFFHCAWYWKRSVLGLVWYGLRDLGDKLEPYTYWVATRQERGGHTDTLMQVEENTPCRVAAFRYQPLSYKVTKQGTTQGFDCDIFLSLAKSRKIKWAGKMG